MGPTVNAAPRSGHAVSAGLGRVWNTPRYLLLLLVTCIALASLSGCQAARYRALEAMGVEKRDILVSRVERARDAQDDARDQFTSALERFRATVEVDGGELEETYSRLSREHDQSVRRARAVSDRINAVESVATDLFKEWEQEIDLYSDPGLAARSRDILRDTRSNYGRMLTAMRRAEASMEPVLAVFQDQVLFLKHNLNAIAIASLRQELAGIEQATAALLEDMEVAIQQADAFLTTLSS